MTRRGTARPATLRAARHAVAAVVTLAGCGAAAVAGPPRDLLVARGRGDEAARPERIDAARSVWRLGDGGSLELATADVVSWGACPPWPLGPVVLLGDGGAIAGTIESLDGATASIRATSFGRCLLPRALVAGFRRGPGAGPGPLAATGRGSRLVLVNGDTIDATTLTWRPGGVAVDSAAGGVTIPAERIAAIDVATPGVPADGDAAGPRAATEPRSAGTRLLVALADGSRLTAAALLPAAEADRCAVVVEMADGPRELVVDRADVVALAVDGGAARLLASLTPAAESHEPVVGPAWPLTVGRTLTGEWPAARGRSGFTALGIHAAAAVRYRLERPAERFTAAVAIDDTTGAGGAAVVRVRARSGGGAWRDVMDPAVLRGGDPPLECAAALGNADELEIAVGPGAGGDVLARTLWIDPRVVAGP